MLWQVSLFKDRMRLDQGHDATTVHAKCIGLTRARHVHVYIGWARTMYFYVYTALANPKYMYVWCIYGNFSREITILTVMYGVYIRLWPFLRVYVAYTMLLAQGKYHMNGYVCVCVCV